MRIVGGRHRGRRLTAPEGLGVRPTADRTREALFNILSQGKLQWSGAAASRSGGDTFAGVHVLDAFAGTGALGLEALSRGAAQAIFMENQAPALTICRANIDALDESARARIVACDVLHPPKAKTPCALVLMDPPYNQDMAPPALTALIKAGWLAPAALVTIELMAKEPFEPPNGFTQIDERKYGKARIVFLRALE